MYVCICNKVTDEQIHQAVQNGACSVDCLHKKLNVGSCCGKCRQCAKKVLHDALTTNFQLENPGGLIVQTA